MQRHEEKSTQFLFDILSQKTFLNIVFIIQIPTKELHLGILVSIMNVCKITKVLSNAITEGSRGVAISAVFRMMK